jgi:hypothetical protein
VIGACRVLVDGDRVRRLVVARERGARAWGRHCWRRPSGGLVGRRRSSSPPRQTRSRQPSRLATRARRAVMEARIEHVIMDKPLSRSRRPRPVCTSSPPTAPRARGRPVGRARGRSTLSPTRSPGSRRSHPA